MLAEKDKKGVVSATGRLWQLREADPRLVMAMAQHHSLPQHLAQRELVGGNAWVESGTFLAILIGTIAGGSLALTF